MGIDDNSIKQTCGDVTRKQEGAHSLDPMLTSEGICSGSDTDTVSGSQDDESAGLTVGRMPRQSSFTYYGCDLATGEPLSDIAGLPKSRCRN